ncbi:hypothetical protein BC937DRAFT_95529 [Endogone sp. FLAS-F59071]|nr:hypothetical protein BC937DRAFT_95529 [Endogone sp. FLAS-F59071]|eukprot:RUS13302.1 hypothetical protein BC937DRAFT_95529 [Endogone sp. FLAS-F59071]
MEKNEEYRIHITLREAIRQHNTELRLRLCLQTSGQYDEVFLIGVPSSSRPGKSMALEWLFHDLQSNASSRLKTKNFCIQYYSIGNAGCQIIEISSNDDNHAKAALPIQLIVFIYKISTTLHDDLPRLCEVKSYRS